MMNPAALCAWGCTILVFMSARAIAFPTPTADPDAPILDWSVTDMIVEINEKTDGAHDLFEGDIVLTSEDERGIEALSVDTDTDAHRKRRSADRGSIGDIRGTNSRGTHPGDDRGTRRVIRGASKMKHKLWPYGRVPYVINSIDPQVRKAVIDAMEEFKVRTCIRFVPRTTQDDYINFYNGSGCWSMIGRTGGPQKLSLGKSCNTVGVVMHEMMHSLGFFHEQSRPDRDDYITIHWNNIKNGLKNQFKKYTYMEIDSLDSPYDTGSVMHYGSYVYAKNRNKPTITDKLGRTFDGQRDGFSVHDVTQLNALYKIECGNRVFCHELRPLEHGTVSGYNSIGDEVRFSCDKGYHVEGPASLTCQPDGTWSGSKPECIVSCRDAYYRCVPMYCQWASIAKRYCQATCNRC